MRNKNAPKKGNIRLPVAVRSSRTTGAGATRREKPWERGCSRTSVLKLPITKSNTYSMGLGQPQPHVRVPAVMTEEVHTLDAPRSRRKFVLTTTAHDWILVMRAHRCNVHHGGDHEIWRESADTAFLAEGKISGKLKSHPMGRGSSYSGEYSEVFISKPPRDSRR